MRRSPAGQYGSLMDQPRIAERAAGVLINAKTGGDAGNRSDHFLGTSLDSKWTASFANNHTINNSVLGFDSAASTLSSITQNFTPSGAFRVEARVATTGDPTYNAGNGHGPNLWIGDAGATNAVFVNFSQSWSVWKIVSGTQTSVADLPGGYQVDTFMTNQGVIANGYSFGLMWAYVALSYNGAGTWQAQGSWDRNFWQNIGSTITGLSPTFAKMKIQGFTNNGPFFVDFVDVVS